MPGYELLALEDQVADIIGKAQRGLKLTAEDLAERADLPLNLVQALRQGILEPETQEGALARLAFVLNLHPPALLALAKAAWQPQPVSVMDGLAMFTTWYGDMTVNAYVVWDPNSREAASFDTGSSCQPMVAHLQANRLQLKRIFITHTHMDHLADLETLQSAEEAKQAFCYGSAVENPLGLKPLVHGDGLILGNLTIRVLGTSGHTPGGLSYFVEGLGKPLVIVGDALFAGSMGGAAYAYHEAIEHIQRRLLTLPHETVICPGHGPLTTVGEERQHNPFFASSK